MGLSKNLLKFIKKNIEQNSTFKVFEPIEITWHISDNTIAAAKDWLRKKEVFKNDALYFIELFTTQEEP